MDATELLMHDHREAEDLFRRFPTQTDEASRRRTAEMLITELSKHDAVEVQLLYPAVRREGEAGDRLAEHSLDEHREARELLHTLDTSLDEVTSDTFLATWQQLERAVAEHVREEETEIFPMMRGNMTPEQLDELGDKMATAKKTAPTHPHPTTPDNPLGATIMGAAARVADKARDAASGRSNS